MDESDQFIIDQIIGTDSPTVEGLPVPESGDGNDNWEDDHEANDRRMRNELAMGEDVDPLLGSTRRSPGPSSSIVPRRRSKADSLNELLIQKKKAQIELLDIEKYKSKLQCLKLEREVGVRPSNWTRDLRHEDDSD